MTPRTALAVGAALLAAGLAQASAQQQPQQPPEAGVSADPTLQAGQAGFRLPPGTPDAQRGQYVMTGGGGAGVGNACLYCHGTDGGGDASGAFPRLAGQPADYLRKQLDDYASGARPNAVMSPIARMLSEDERRTVSIYYGGQRPPAAPAPVAPDPALVQWGGVLSAVGSAERGIQACQNCHGPAGAGLPPLYPALAGQHASYTELQLRLWRDGTRTNDPVGLMQGVARHLTDEDIRAAALYFASLRPPGAAQER